MRDDQRVIGLAMLFIIVGLLILTSLAFGLQCPPSPGPFGTSELSPDGRYLVCLADAAVPGKYELYAVDGIRDPWRLSPGMADDRDVNFFAIAPDSQLVAFTSDRATWTKYDLYSVPIAGGTAKRLNGPLPVEHDVAEGFLWSAGRVVYRQGRNTTGLWELFSVPGSGGSAVRISQPGAPGSGVQPGFTILDGERVRYAYTDGGVEAAWYVVPASGGRVMEEIMREDFERGTNGGFQ